MLKNKDIKIGDHCWAISNNELLVVLKTSDRSYEVCGDWELGIGAEQINIIEIINKPIGHENTKLYYISTKVR